jgi:phthalate 4,5-dioxygenase oxygenase subunit
MLTPHDNERMTRVGRGTPMGRLLRSYWIPACLTSEVPDADGPPARVRLLGEDLIAFRDTDGKVGLVDAFCPHRRAPMFFGRNEECGLRCVYHGWKFDRDGTCVDMPSEPADSLFKTKVTIDAYPTWEGGGIVWTYMGPRDQQPPFPDYELVRTPATHHFASKTHESCNWLQALEGGVDPTHATILHNEHIGDRSFLRDFNEIVAELQIDTTDYGIFYAGIRDHGDDEQWVRGYHYIAPFYHMRGTVDAVFWGRRADTTPTINGHIWVPIDDEQCWVYNFMYSYDPSQPISREQALYDEARAGRGPDDLDANRVPKQNRTNDYLIDRAKQRTSSFTGIRGINTQDFVVQEGMGTINDRSKEHLGSTDRCVIALRRVLLDALDRQERGEPLPGQNPATYRNIRAIDRLIPRKDAWRDTLRGELVARF